jgi:hypothetical protein
MLGLFRKTVVVHKKINMRATPAAYRAYYREYMRKWRKTKAYRDYYARWREKCKDKERLH